MRERPLLTQISRQINSSTPIITDNKQSTRVHSDTNNKAAQEVEEDHQTTTEGTKENNAQEERWSSDVARNISRNKYLIKFREFDKRNSISPVQLLTDDEPKPDVHKSDLEVSNNLTLKESIITRAEEEKMKLPLSEIVKSDELPDKQLNQLSVDPKVIRTESNQDICDKQEVESKLKSKAPPKEKRNIKLKLKTINANSNSEPDKAATKLGIEAVSATSESTKAPTEVVMKKDPRKEEEKVSSPSKTPSPSVGDVTSPVGTKAKVKKLIKKSSSKVAIESKSTSDIDASQTNEVNTNSSPPDSAKPKPLAKKLSKQKEQKHDGIDDTKKVKKSEPKSQIVADERKVLSLKQLSDNKEVIRGDDDEVIKKKKKQTKIVSSSQKEINKSTAAAPEIATSKSANLLSGGSSPISSGANNIKRIRFREYKYDDFNFLSVLGHGGWGFVILAELKDYDACFAVKCIKKITIVEDDDFDSIMIERKVLTLGNVNPFICKLFCTFETEVSKLIWF